MRFQLGHFLQGVTQGMVQGHQYRQEQQRKDEELKLRKRMFESQDKLRQRDAEKIAQALKEKQAQEVQRQSLRDTLLQSTMSGDELFREAGVDPPSTAARSFFDQARTRSLRQALIGLPESKDKDFLGMLGMPRSQLYRLGQGQRRLLPQIQPPLGRFRWDGPRLIPLPPSTNHDRY